MTVFGLELVIASSQLFLLVGLNLHLDPAKFQAAVKWWLGIAVSDNTLCPFCLSHALDPVGHHALTCKHGVCVASRYNRLRDVLLESCQQAMLRQEVVWGMKDIEHDQLKSHSSLAFEQTSSL